MASKNFTNLAKHIARGLIDFDVDIFKVMLVTEIPSIIDTTGDMDTWVFRADVTTEVVGVGYVAGGIDCTPPAGVLDLINEKFIIDFPDKVPGWTAATISSVGAIIYQSVGTAATDRLVTFVDFNGTVISTDGNYDVLFADTLDIGI